MASAAKDKCRIDMDSVNSLPRTQTCEKALGSISDLHKLVKQMSKLPPEIASCNDVTVVSNVLVSSCVTASFLHNWVRTKHQQFVASSLWESAFILADPDLVSLSSKITLLMNRIVEFINDRKILMDSAGVKYLQRVFADHVSDLHELSTSFRSRTKKAVSYRSKTAWTQHFPDLKLWRLKGSIVGPHQVSDYVGIAIHQVITPIVNALRNLPLSEGNNTLESSVDMFFRMWMQYVLEKEVKFSLQGATQLQTDVNYVRNWFSSQELGLSEEQLTEIETLPVISDFLNGIALLLCQPAGRRGSSTSDAEASNDSLASAITRTSQGSISSMLEERIQSIECPNKDQWLSLRLKKPRPRSRFLCLPAAD